MSKYAIEGSTLNGLANAVRSFKHTEANLTLEQMTAAIAGYKWPWMGDGMELVNGNLYSKTTKLSATEFNTWTPSTTAKDILASENASTFTATDMVNNQYYIVWKCDIPIVTASTATKKALPVHASAYIVHEIFRRPNTLANISADVFNGNTSATLYGSTWITYYGTTTGTQTYTWAASYGMYFTAAQATFSSSTSDSPTVTPKTPKVSARCSTTYMSTTNAGLIDKDKTAITIKGAVYRARQPGVLRSVIGGLIDVINGE